MIRIAIASVALWAVVFLCAPLFVGTQALEARRAAELQHVRHSLGGPAEDGVRRFAAWAARGLPSSRPGAAGAGPAVRADVHALQPPKGFVPGYLQRLQLQARVAAARAGVLLAWMAALGPLLAAAIVDGRMQGRVRRTRGMGAHPAAFSLSGLASAGLLSIPIAYVALPLPWPGGWAPAWALAAAPVLAWRASLGRTLAAA